MILGKDTTGYEGAGIGVVYTEHSCGPPGVVSCLIGRADIVVIGAGSTGTSIAFHLAAKRAGRIALVERSNIAYGSTGRSVAIVRQHYGVETLARMARRSLSVFERFNELVGGDSGFVKTGLLVAAGASQLATLKETVEMNRRVGVDVRLIEPREATGIMRGLNGKGLAGLAYETEAGFADPSLVASSFAEAASQLGAHIYTNTEVSSINVRDGAVLGVATSAGDVRCDRVVVAANVWSSKLCLPLGIQLPVKSVRSQVATFRRPADYSAPHPVYFDLPSSFYMRSERRSTTIVGKMGGDIESRLAEPDNFNSSADQDYVVSTGATAAERYLPLSQSISLGGWSGLIDVTPDWQPILDQAPGIKGLYLAVGFSGHGFKLSPAVGDMVSDLVLRGKSPQDDITVFSYDRFLEGKPIVPAYGGSVLS